MTRDEFFNKLRTGAKWDVGVAIARTNPVPLDANEIFDSVSAMETYIKTNALAYPGQIVVVLGTASTNAYLVKTVGASGTYVELASTSTTGDINTTLTNLSNRVDAIEEWKDTVDASLANKAEQSSLDDLSKKVLLRAKTTVNGKEFTYSEQSEIANVTIGAADVAFDETQSITDKIGTMDTSIGNNTTVINNIVNGKTIVKKALGDKNGDDITKTYVKVADNETFKKSITPGDSTATGARLISTDEISKLNGIASGAQVNKIESVKVNGTALTIADDKSVNVEIPETNVKTLDTTSTAALATNASEAIKGTGKVSLHKIAKTGTFNDLVNKPFTTTADGDISSLVKVKGADAGIEIKHGTDGSSIKIDSKTILVNYIDASTTKNNTLSFPHADGTLALKEDIDSAKLELEQSIDHCSEGLAAAESKITELTTTTAGHTTKIQTIEDNITTINGKLGKDAAGNDIAKTYATAKSLSDYKTENDAKVTQNTNDIATLKENVTGGMHFKGKFTALPATTSYSAGDFVIVGSKEYILFVDDESAKSWVELGDEGSHLTKVQADGYYDPKGKAQELIEALDVAVVNVAAGETIKSISEVDGKIAVEKQSIAIEQSAVEGLSDALAGKQDKITSTNKLDASLIANLPEGHNQTVKVGKVEFGADDAVIFEGSNGVAVSADAATKKISIKGSYANASTTAAGLMSSDDKSKLDGVAEGAQVNKLEQIRLNGTFLTNDPTKFVDVSVVEAIKADTGLKVSGTNKEKTIAIDEDVVFVLDGGTSAGY